MYTESSDIDVKVNRVVYVSSVEQACVLYSERGKSDVPGWESQRHPDFWPVRGPSGRAAAADSVRAGDGVHAEGFGGRAAADAGRSSAVAARLPHGSSDRPGNELPSSAVSSAAAPGPEAQQRAAERQPRRQGESRDATDTANLFSHTVFE